MNIALALDQFDELNTQPPASTSPKRSRGLAYWILLAGILSGFAALALATIANAQR